MILVTGGAGYIGSHVVQLLSQSGYETLILDNLVNGHRDLVENVLKVPLIVGDIQDYSLLRNIFATYPITAVMHFAAFAYVGESIEEPAKYYQNNVSGTLNLLRSAIEASVQYFVFSSTCATYGIPQVIPVTEDHLQQPINPYGSSKLMAEQVLQDLSRAYGLKSVCFRFFNAAGASLDGQLGEDHNPEPHLLPLVLLTALDYKKCVSIFGTDYPTPDGTCIRDYIHVLDIARAHILGLQYLLDGGGNETFNLGNGNGFSVRQVLEMAQEVTGRPIKVLEKERRPGDPPILVSSSDKASRILGWQPQYSDLKEMLRHAWLWHQRRHQLIRGTSSQ